jgi:hypothetical protein
MFYELNTWDPFGNTPWKRTTDDSLNGTFEGDHNVFAQITLVTDPDATFAQQNDIEGASTSIQTVAAATADDDVDDEDGIIVNNWLPDG